MLKYIIFINFFFIGCLQTFSQVSLVGVKNKNLKKAIVLYNSMDYSQVPEQLESYRHFDSGSYDDTLALRLLADSYWKMRNYEKSKFCYDNLLAITKDVSYYSRFHLSHLYAMKGNYDLATRLLLSLNNVDDIINGYLNTSQFLQDSLDYNVIISNTKPNISKRELSPFILRDSLFWNLQVSDLPKPTISDVEKFKKKSKNAKKANENVFNNEDQLSSFFNPVAISYNSSSKKVYFTIKSDADDVNQLRIAESDIKGSSLKELHTFSLGTGVYTMINPVISPDGSVLVFLSNKNDNQYDLYYCLKSENKWSRPFSFSSINTSGDELFPFFDSNGDYLYFSSNGRAGLGGLDIYKVKLKIMGGDDVVEHLPYPINTSHDDYKLSMIDDGSKGYFISDRSGRDEIYAFDFKLKYRKIFGSLKFDESKKPITGRLIYLYEKSNTENGKSNWTIIDSTLSDDDGNYKFTVRPNRIYKSIITDEKKNIESYIESNDNVASINIETILIPDLVIKKPDEDEVVGKFIINYEFGKSTLTKSSKLVLDSLVSNLKDNPTFYGIAASFTDCSGKPEYNLKLSAKRSKEMMAYLISKGVPVSKLKESHFGNEYLLVPCEVEKFKSSSQKVNRRTEIYVSRSNSKGWEQLHADTTISVIPVDFKHIEESVKDRAANNSDYNVSKYKNDPIKVNDEKQNAKKSILQSPNINSTDFPVDIKPTEESVKNRTSYNAASNGSKEKIDPIKVNNDKQNPEKSNLQALNINATPNANRNSSKIEIGKNIINAEPKPEFYSKPIIIDPKTEAQTTSNYDTKRQRIYTYNEKENESKNPIKDNANQNDVRTFLNKQYNNTNDKTKQNNIPISSYSESSLSKGNLDRNKLNNPITYNSEEQIRIKQYTQRENKKSIIVNSFSDSINIEIFDNGVDDHDTISVIFNNKIVIDRHEIGTNVKDPIRFSLKLNDDPLKNQMIIVAENLGTEPPNSALMIITDNLKHYKKIYLTTDLLHNEVVYFINLSMDK